MDYTDHINGDGYDDERQNDNDVLRDDLVELIFFFSNDLYIPDHPYRLLLEYSNKLLTLLLVPKQRHTKVQ